ncbi:GNAT family N-acetyltransferase [Novosphingobium lentum]|uniref:GNAT family N-acetyltransferase n=1 Tax=Novosphingobium lentum TaxID=145287 RepID=UPI00083161D7|nr:GNAT family N-acetyltransferase [Novosphingobium lentum]
MSDGLRIVEDDASGKAITALIAFHLAEMHRYSPACSVHALPAEKLREPGVTFYAAWMGADLAGCGAIKQLDATHGELKSMRAAPAFRGKGVGEAVLLHLIAEARLRGYTRLSLETGRGEAFEPALGLYRKHGFTDCGPFADYVPDDFSVYLTLRL